MILVSRTQLKARRALRVLEDEETEYPPCKNNQFRSHTEVLINIFE